MKIRKILVGIILAAVLALTACSDADTQQSAEDAALQQKLIGVWLYPESAEYDEDGDMTSFSAYEFTDQIAKRHDVQNGRIMSSAIDKYTIEDGYYIVKVDGKKQGAVIEIKEVDGKDHLFWSIDTGTQEFVRMTNEEVEEYGIPAGKLLSSEAQLLGIETTTEETDLEITTASETETASETSAVSE